MLRAKRFYLAFVAAAIPAVHVAFPAAICILVSRRIVALGVTHHLRTQHSNGKVPGQKMQARACDQSYLKVYTKRRRPPPLANSTMHCISKQIGRQSGKDVSARYAPTSIPAAHRCVVLTAAVAHHMLPDANPSPIPHAPYPALGQILKIAAAAPPAAHRCVVLAAAHHMLPDVLQLFDAHRLDQKVTRTMCDSPHHRAVLIIG